MARPRLVVELFDKEFNHTLKVVAVQRRMTIREVILVSLGSHFPELHDAVVKELDQHKEGPM